MENGVLKSTLDDPLLHNELGAGNEALPPAHDNPYVVSPGRADGL